MTWSINHAFANKSISVKVYTYSNEFTKNRNYFTHHLSESQSLNTILCLPYCTETYCWAVTIVNINSYAMSSLRTNDKICQSKWVNIKQVVYIFVRFVSYLMRHNNIEWQQQMNASSFYKLCCTISKSLSSWGKTPKVKKSEEKIKIKFKWHFCREKRDIQKRWCVKWWELMVDIYFHSYVHKSFANKNMCKMVMWSNGKRLSRAHTRKPIAYGYFEQYSEAFGSNNTEDSVLKMTKNEFEAVV